MSLTHADTERNLLNHYQITNLYPEAWPAEKDEENGLDSDDERDTATAKAAKAAKAKQAKQSKRYTTLGRGPSNRSSVPGSQRSGDGVESLVQKDEADPLGNFPSVVSVLRQRGLPVESDVELRKILSCAPSSTRLISHKGTDSCYPQLASLPPYFYQKSTIQRLPSRSYKDSTCFRDLSRRSQRP